VKASLLSFCFFPYFTRTFFFLFPPPSFPKRFYRLCLKATALFLFYNHSGEKNNKKKTTKKRVFSRLSKREQKDGATTMMMMADDILLSVRSTTRVVLVT